MTFRSRGRNREPMALPPPDQPAILTQGGRWITRSRQLVVSQFQIETDTTRDLIDLITPGSQDAPKNKQSARDPLLLIASSEGKMTVISVPTPTVLSNSTLPRWSAMIAFTTLRPRPVPG